MIGKNNKLLKQQKEGRKVESFSIKKFKVGTASVLIGASVFFGVLTTSTNQAHASNQVNENKAEVAEKVDKAPLTENEQINNWKKYADKNTDRLLRQVKWFDINNKNAVVENLGEGGKLKVGTKFKQELSPGYVVELEVKALKPFNATDTYKERGGAGYDANAKNEYKDGTEAELKVVPQGGYSIMKTNGIDTKGATVIQSVKNGANVGVEFAVKATLNGKEVPANVIFATGEEAGSSEIEIYKTDGDGFELVTESSSAGGEHPTYRSYTAESYDNRYNVPSTAPKQSRQLGNSYTVEGEDKPTFEKFAEDKAQGFRSKEITSETISVVKDKDGTIYTDGLGTQVFGPVATHRASGMSAPLVMTRNAKNVGLYILSSGQQGAMLGFMMIDSGDAPSSYGRVAHSIAKGNGISQPYLGSVAPDLDVRTEKITEDNAFVYDDNHGDGPADEGAAQLMGEHVAKNNNYNLKKVNDKTYEMTIKANLDGNKSAWVNGWIDFNNNGKFDENEASGPVEVTKDGDVTLRWSNTVQNLDLNATKLATRIRIAVDKADVKEPTGVAYSGEVEDFQIQQTIPPRGTKETTIDNQGVTQNATIKFEAYGHKSYETEEKAKIDENVKPQIVKPDGTIVQDSELVDGYYVVPDQGKYKITANGKDVNVEFVPEDQFVGDADGITIRRTDTNGDTTGWGKNGLTIINGSGTNHNDLELISEQVSAPNTVEKGTMDGRYIPRVVKRELKGEEEVSNDIQGQKQFKTLSFKDTANNVIKPSKEYPVKIVDPKTGKTTDDLKVDATKDGKKVGTYEVDPTTGKITFTPNKDFVGEADPISISLTGKVGVDKNGQPVTATAVSTYQPTVKPIEPTAENGETSKPQGEIQEKEITFTPGKNKVTYIGKDDEVIEVEKSVPMNPEKYTLLGENGEPSKEVPAKDPKGNVVGTFSLKVVDGKPTVVFTPTDKTYVGPVQSVTIQGEDENGTKATAKYTPNITPVVPTAEPTKTTAKQGDVQKGTPNFTSGSSKTEMVPSTLTLLDDNGKPVDTLPATDLEGNKIGTYTVDKTTGEVIFTPTDKTYSGKVKPVNIQMSDTNGTSVKTTYTPNILPVKPKAKPSKSTAPQGIKQEGTLKFTGGKVNINGTEETVKIKEKSARLLDNDGNVLSPESKLDAFNSDGKKVGEYTIDPTTNKVIYTPTDLTYVGEVIPAIVRAEDENGITVETTYTPNITPVEPTGDNSKTTGNQGEKQTSKVVFDTPDKDDSTLNFNKGDEKINIKKDTLTLVNEKGEKVSKIENKGEGTYELVNGEIVFTPEKTFVGVAKGVKVQVFDQNGTSVEKTYTPTVLPITEFVDKDGKPITVDKDNKKVESKVNGKVDKKDIPGYTYVETKVDEKGNTRHIYEKATKVKTFFKDKDGNEIPEYPSVDGTVDKKDIPEYKFVETKKLPNGDVEHIYEKVSKVKTFFKDKDGNEIPKYPSVDGNVDKKDIPDYKFVETKKLPNGDVEHIYEKVSKTKTFFKDKDGNELPKYPSVDGTVDKKDIPEYKFVETKKLPNGDVEHIYEKVNKVKTFFKDKDGNEIPEYPSVNGTVDKKAIPEYKFVETKKLPNGDVEHIYEKVSKVKTFFKDKDGNEIPEYPSVDGTVDKKDIPEYKFVETKKLPNGDIVHVYEKVDKVENNKEDKEVIKKEEKLPNTSSNSTTGVASLTLLSLMAMFKSRKKQR